jgi:hypothetical protein
MVFGYSTYFLLSILHGNQNGGSSTAKSIVVPIECAELCGRKHWFSWRRSRDFDLFPYKLAYRLMMA